MKVLRSQNRFNIILIFLIAVIAVVCLSLLFVNYFNKIKEDRPLSFSDYLSQSSSTEEAITKYTQLIEKEKDATTRASMYEDRFTALIADDDSFIIYKDQIVSDMEEYNTILQSAHSAYVLYDYYTHLGDDAQAERYWNLVESRSEMERQEEDYVEARG